MTKSLSHLLSAGALSLSLLAASGASAEVIFTETFDYPAGNLYGNPGWLRGTGRAAARERVVCVRSGCSGAAP